MKAIGFMFLFSVALLTTTLIGSAHANNEPDIAAEAWSYLHLILRLNKPAETDHREVFPLESANKKQVSLETILTKASLRYSIKKTVILAVIRCESNFDPMAVSAKGARGLMQIMPDTAEDLGVDPDNLYDPATNINAGTKYIRYLANRYDGNLDTVAAAYNAGPGRVDSRRRLPLETRRYIKCVNKMYHHFSRQAEGGE